MKKRVLVVDDDQVVRDSVGKVLEGAGYEVVLAAGGLEAVVRFESDQIHLVLLDLGLPNQNGWAVYERLNTHYPMVPVIIITGQVDQSRRAAVYGADAVFEKPIEVPALLTTMEALLAGSNGGNPSRSTTFP